MIDQDEFSSTPRRLIPFSPLIIDQVRRMAVPAPHALFAPVEFPEFRGSR